MVRELALGRTKRLIRGFTSLEETPEQPDASSLERLLVDFRKALLRTREAQGRDASELDMLRSLGVEEDLREKHHSKFLAWLLDPDETHEQGTLFFRALLRQVGLPEDYAAAEYDVRREQQGEESRIDVVVASRRRGARGFVIYVENKVTAKLGHRQIEREAQDLIAEAKMKEIPRWRTHGLLLTPEPEQPRSRLFRRIGWDTI
ncbi:hypothetical protein FJY71_07815, partial [candidate division WOR-3 bacterium]|nr:hypothetical protein [candidate division WOR-3 bacterium]